MSTTCSTIDTLTCLGQQIQVALTHLDAAATLHADQDLDNPFEDGMLSSKLDAAGDALEDIAKFTAVLLKNAIETQAEAEIDHVVATAKEAVRSVMTGETFGATPTTDQNKEADEADPSCPEEPSSTARTPQTGNPFLEIRDKEGNLLFYVGQQGETFVKSTVSE